MCSLLFNGGELMDGNPYTRNPSSVRGNGETLGSYIDRLHELIRQYQWQSQGHIRWYTHKNPAGCWICETIQAGEQAHIELMALERFIRELEGIPDEIRRKLLTEKLDLNIPKSDEL